MEKFNYNKEWNFVFDEMKKIHENNSPDWHRNLLLCVREILEDYHKEMDRNRKIILRFTFQKAKSQYVLMTENRSNRRIPRHLYSDFKKFFNSYKLGELN